MHSVIASTIPCSMPPVKSAEIDTPVTEPVGPRGRHPHVPRRVHEILGAGHAARHGIRGGDRVEVEAILDSVVILVIKPRIALLRPALLEGAIGIAVAAIDGIRGAPVMTAGGQTGRFLLRI